MGNITLIQNVRKDEQVPETRDRKVCKSVLYSVGYLLTDWFYVANEL